eukprot:CAMPEP_0184358208 /NCGR_PEP_ID=MMETSP1089-20130417/113262_1 /TAXON_ID=38269 ORGANISM="Gloeochaete wittrockiana, Strain SAG46.84" /NCGR_SAMPLE_ID=MMETSP1089 /ASSEMBLY_ACC=CAM_ASM_000445 /LENGTH=122 /DNA_ID=CAMNT_0026696403 /DNA_START=26 /DNA_END=394 /DNA_ORIENTATION=+
MTQSRGTPKPNAKALEAVLAVSKTTTAASETNAQTNQSESLRTSSSSSVSEAVSASSSSAHPEKNLPPHLPLPPQLPQQFRRNRAAPRPAQPISARVCVCLLDKFDELEQNPAFCLTFSPVQ